MDEWSILDEVDVIALWPSTEREKLTSSKWLERKESLESLHALLEKNPRLTPTATIYGEIMDELRKILSKDSNINVVLMALKVVARLAKGLRQNFNCFISMLYCFVLEKSKDKKQNVRDSVGEALDSMSACCDPDRIVNYLSEHLAKPSPQTKETILLFLYRFFITLKSPPMSFIKTIIPISVKLASDSDPAVREAACSSLGSAKRLLGDALNAFTTSLVGDKAKLDKIEDYLKKATDERKSYLESLGGTAGSVTVSENTERESAGVESEDNSNDPVAIDSWVLKDPVDICPQLSKTWNQEITDAKWQIRKEACENILSKLEGEPRLVFSTDLKEIISTLLKVLEKDLNINVNSSAAKCLKGISDGVRFEYGASVPKTIHISLEKLKEKKEVLRRELISLVDSASYLACLTNYTEAVSNGLKNKNPQSRSQSCQFLARLFSRHDRNTIPVDAVKVLAPDLEKCCSDGDGEVRESAFKAVASLWNCLGEALCLRLFPTINETKLKLEKVTSLAPALVEEFGVAASPEIVRLYKKLPAKSTSTKPPTASRNVAPKVSSASRPASTTSRSASAALRPASTVSRPASTVSRPASTASHPSSAASRPAAPPNLPFVTMRKAPVKVVSSSLAPAQAPSKPAVREPIRPQSANLITSSRVTPLRPQSSTIGKAPSNSGRTTPVSKIGYTPVRSEVTALTSRMVTPVSARPVSNSKIPPSTGSTQIRLPSSRPTGLRPPTCTSKIPGLPTQKK